MRLLIFLLKCLVGLFATLGFLMVAGVVAGVLLLREAEPLRPRALAVPDPAVLTLDLGDGLIEARPANPFSRLTWGGALVLREAVQALDEAGQDPRVKGLFLRLGHGDVGLAQAQELRGAVAAFRERGKFVVAFAESFGEAGDGTLHYYLASAASTIWLQPSGEVGVTGLSLESPFLREALEEIGVTPRLAQREAYKGAMNTFTDAGLPAPQRENLQRLLDSSLAGLLADVAANRNLPAERVRSLIDTAPHAAEAAQDAGLIDRLGYLDEAEADALAQARPAQGDDGATLVALQDYMAREGAPEPSGAVIALIYGLGPIVLGDGESDPSFGSLTLGSDRMVRALHDATEDDEVEAIVLRIDSPGGSYVASDAIWGAIRRARENDIPVVVSMGNVAASGGYFVAAPASRIVAQPGTITGSIGVVGGKFVLRELWDRLGVNWDGVKAGDNADIWSLNRDFTREEWAKVEAMLDRTYADFLGKVAEGRGLSAAETRRAAQGKVWSGADAKGAGLVDALGGLRTAVALASESAGLPAEAPVQLRLFPEERDPFEALLEEALGGRIPDPGFGARLRSLAGLLEALGPLVDLAERLRDPPQQRVLRAPDLEGRQ